jgi:ribosomal protein S18 acetylase RimI-like enzyme
MTSHDLDVAAALHTQHFPRNIAARFGRRFVRAYLETFLRSPAAVGLVAVRESGTIVGYLVGVTSTELHRPFVRSQRRVLLRAAAPGLVRNSWFLARVLMRKIKNRVESASNTNEPGSVEPVAVLSHVAVAETHRSSGAGGALVRAFELAALAAGTDKAVLATVVDDEDAGAFYRRLGWTQVSEGRTIDRRHLHVYEKNLELQEQS